MTFKLVAQFALIVLSVLPNALNGEPDWWRTGSFYQIYPRSFMDSNNNGIGDLNGITQRLPYLKEIGVTATWLSPIFTSPMADFGYDIANFTEIDPLFGSMADFEALLARATELGIKIILDFVPNHTSDEHEWFRKSAAGVPQYRDYYVWHTGKMVNGLRQPPNNWLAVFRGSAWSWNEQRQAYYLHQFHAKQPDLNYRNPQVVAAMKEVLRFWLRKGVAGFRVDALPHMYEIAANNDGDWPDEPRNTAENDLEDYNSLLHVYTQNQPETVAQVYDFRRVLEEMDAVLLGDERILLTEAYAPLEVLMQYYGNGTHRGAHIPFNFELISNVNKESNARDYAKYINRWLQNMPAGASANWVLGNHDQSRIGTRLGAERMNALNILLQTLPGASVTYQGEELGMTNGWISWADSIDPQACQTNSEIYEKFSRDPARTPFHWDDSINAGFSSAPKTWLPVADNYKTVNVKLQRDVPNSYLSNYKALKTLRAEPALQRGQTEVLAANNNVLIIKRELPGERVYISVLNLFGNTETVNLLSLFPKLSMQLEYALITGQSAKQKGDLAQTEAISLLPNEAVVLRTPLKS